MSSEDPQNATLGREEFAQAARKFEKASRQLSSLRLEIGELSKKKPDGPINKFKLGFINRLLEDVNPFLAEMKPFAEFTLFDPDTMPTNSDVKLILSLYLASCQTKRGRDARRDPDTEAIFWYMEDEPIIEMDSRDDRFYDDRYEDVDDDSAEYEDEL